MPEGAAGLAGQSPRRGPSGRRAQRQHPQQRRVPLTANPGQSRTLPVSRPCPRKARQPSEPHPTFPRTEPGAVLKFKPAALPAVSAQLEFPALGCYLSAMGRFRAGLGSARPRAGGGGGGGQRFPRARAEGAKRRAAPRAAAREREGRGPAP